MKTFNNEASILAGMGVTVVVSTGDYGVSNVKCACSSNSGWNATGTDWPVRFISSRYHSLSIYYYSLSLSYYGLFPSMAQHGVEKDIFHHFQRQVRG